MITERLAALVLVSANSAGVMRAVVAVAAVDKDRGKGFAVTPLKIES